MEAGKVTHMFAREPSPFPSEFFLPPQLSWLSSFLGRWLPYPWHVPPKTGVHMEQRGRTLQMSTERICLV